MDSVLEMPAAETIEVAAVLNALSDPVRLRIVDALHHRVPRRSKRTTVIGRLFRCRRSDRDLSCL